MLPMPRVGLVLALVALATLVLPLASAQEEPGGDASESGMSTGAWFTVVLMVAIGGIAIGFAFGRGWWAWWKPPPPCGAACNCPGGAAVGGTCPHRPGHGCGMPGCIVGLPAGHTHCIVRACRLAGMCTGTCTLAPGHAGMHSCTHTHSF